MKAAVYILATVVIGQGGALLWVVGNILRVGRHYLEEPVMPILLGEITLIALGILAGVACLVWVLRQDHTR